MREVINRISKEDITDLYIVDNMSKKEVATVLGITVHMLSNLFKYYSIKKEQCDINELRKRTNVSRYDVDNPSKNQSIKDKILKTNLDRYGAPSYTATDCGKEKVANTKKERYGDSKYNNINKVLSTKLDRYGVATYNNRDKMRDTCLKSIGVDNPFKDNEIINSIKEKRAREHGYTQEFIDIMFDKEKSLKFLSNFGYTYHELSKRFCAPYYIIQQWVYKVGGENLIKHVFDGTSEFEDSVIGALSRFGVCGYGRKNTSVLSNKQEIDIYFDEHNVGIECNGDYWHSDIFKDRNYHQNKSLIAQMCGIKLIHLYEHQWERINSDLKLVCILQDFGCAESVKIDSNGCVVTNVNYECGVSFCNLYGMFTVPKNSFFVGFYFKNDLVGVSCFVHSCGQVLMVGSCHKIGVVIKNYEMCAIDYVKNLIGIDNITFVCDFGQMNDLWCTSKGASTLTSPKTIFKLPYCYKNDVHYVYNSGYVLYYL